MICLNKTTQNNNKCLFHSTLSYSILLYCIIFIKYLYDSEELVLGGCMYGCMYLDRGVRWSLKWGGLFKVHTQASRLEYFLTLLFATAMTLSSINNQYSSRNPCMLQLLITGVAFLLLEYVK